MNTVERHFTDTGQRVLLKAKNPNDEYFSHKVFKDKAELCRVSMPYCLSDEEPAPKPFKPLNKKQAFRKMQTSPLNLLKLPLEPPVVEQEKPPINEYLNYELSEEINHGIKAVMTIADQIKRIKQEKKSVVQQFVQKKQKKGRVCKSNFRTSKQNNIGKLSRI